MKRLAHLPEDGQHDEKTKDACNQAANDTFRRVAASTPVKPASNPSGSSQTDQKCDDAVAHKHYCTASLLLLFKHTWEYLVSISKEWRNESSQGSFRFLR